ncbi:MAG: hypothetical protein NTY45_07680 [Elusimicrobia bacterium]|nr:hypothetical protein [Elusimicrobiota bacterium]
MKNGFILLTALILAAGAGAASAAADNAPKVSMVVKQNPVPVEIDKAKNLKEILFRLVRQDEYLDEALETLDASRPLSAHELSAMGLNLKMIAGNLNRVSALNKSEFAAIAPDANISTYTNAIFSYSRKVARKTARISALTAQLAVKNKKAAMRDAVSAKSRKGKKAGGKKIAQLLAEQSAVSALAADARKLCGASRNAAATSKWLFIASK